MSYNFRPGHYVRFKPFSDGRPGAIHRVTGTRDNGFEVYLEPLFPDPKHPWSFTYYDNLLPDPVSLLEVLAEVSR